MVTTRSGSGSTPAWVSRAVFYEIMPDRFRRSSHSLAHEDQAAFEPWDATPAPKAHKGGDLWGVVDELERLADLGITALYLTPIFTSPTYHRYKPVDFLAVDPLLGGNVAFDRLLDEAHRRGIRVVLDGVFGHVGLGFPRFQDVLEYGERSPWRSWFRIAHHPLNPFDTGRPPGYRCWNGNRTMPQLNHRTPAVREFILDVAESWVRKGIDGWRFDAADTIDADGFWQEMRARLKRANPEVYLLGEVWTDPSRWLDGTQWDGAMNYPLHGLCRSFAAGRRIRPEHLHREARPGSVLHAPELAAETEKLFSRFPFEHVLSQLNLINSHDVARFITVAGEDKASMGLATLLLFTLPGAPCLFYGDEVGLAGGMPPDCRRGFPPRERWDERCLADHRELIALRRSVPALCSGSYRVLHAAGDLLGFVRGDGPDRAVVLANAGDEPTSAVLALPDRWRIAYGNAEIGHPLDGTDRTCITVGPRQGAILLPAAENRSK